MTSVFLQGGLGNQLFQIATAYAHSKNVGDKLTLENGQHHLPLQGSNVDTYKDIFYKGLDFLDGIDVSGVYHEPSFEYSSIPLDTNLYLVGYFQSEKYFVDYKPEIKRLFDVDQPGDMLKNTISLHVRRGDYLNAQDNHPCLSMEYYSEALKEFPEELKVLVFSDDITWCKSNFIGDRFEFVEGQKDHEDLLKMICCSDHIIANSSFSWWGAWLSGEGGKVIAPKKWFGPKGPADSSDLIPKKWKRV